MEVPSVCPNKSICVNKLGSYDCSCISGYETNGMGMCTGILTILYSSACTCHNSSKITKNMNLHYWRGKKLLNYFHYVDINECASSDAHSCSQSCINTDGSYDCFCFNGYVKRFKYFCFGITVDTLIAMLAIFLIDINECSNSSLHNCTINEVCQNTVGGFACQCKEGFTHENDGTPCERMLTLMCTLCALQDDLLARNYW